MAIIATTGPVNKSLQPAYRPSLINALDNGATGTPPEVYCDIYFDGTYYKTISNNVPSLIIGALTSWIFDVSGLAQEYIKTKVYDITANTIVTIYDGAANLNGETLVYCKIRTSTQDSYGVLTPAGPVPVQATYNSAAVAGGGYVSDQSWYLVNATLQVQDSMGLEFMLQAFRISGAFDLAGHVDSTYRIYQLSYKGNDNIYATDYGQMAMLFANNAFRGASTGNIQIVLLVYIASGLGVTFLHTVAPIAANSNRIYLLPVGMKNLLAMFTGFSGLTLSSAAYYRVALVEPAVWTGGTGPMAYVSPKFYIQGHDGVVNGMNYNLPAMNTSVPRHTRVWFRNYLGQFDAINFIERIEKLKVTSDTRELPIRSIPDGFKRSQLSKTRFNARSFEVNEITGYFTENYLQLIKQLCASNQVYIEFTSPEGPSDPPKAILLPIIIVDAEYPTQEWEDRFEYAVKIQYIPSNENVLIR